MKIDKYLVQERIKIRELLQKGFHPIALYKKTLTYTSNRIQNHYKRLDIFQPKYKMCIITNMYIHFAKIFWRRTLLGETIYFDIHS